MGGRISVQPVRAETLIPPRTNPSAVTPRCCARRVNNRNSIRLHRQLSASEFFIIAAQEALTICSFVRILATVFGAVTLGCILIMSSPPGIVAFAVANMFRGVFDPVAITLVICYTRDISTVIAVTTVSVIWIVGWIIRTPIPMVGVVAVVRD